MFSVQLAYVSTRCSQQVVHQMFGCPQRFFDFSYIMHALYDAGQVLRQTYHCEFFTLLGEDVRSKKSASSEPPKKAEGSDQVLPSKEKGSIPEPLATATAESGEAKKLTDQREATSSGEGEQATVAEQQDQEQGHRESSEEPGVCVLCSFWPARPIHPLFITTLS